MKGFKDKLREARKKKGITQEKLAKMLGISRQQVINYESGNSCPSYDRATAILDKIEGNE